MYVAKLLEIFYLSKIYYYVDLFNRICLESSLILLLSAYVRVDRSEARRTFAPCRNLHLSLLLWLIVVQLHIADVDLVGPDHDIVRPLLGRCRPIRANFVVYQIQQFTLLFK
jgi:glucan phosphoethanolaminetransferase (alkaline phosphatase superfamily)